MPHLPTHHQVKDTTDVEMEGATPPRTSGNKRAAISSPPRPESETNRAALTIDDPEGMDIPPARLADKFEMPPKKKASSAPPVDGNSQEALQFHWLDPKIYADLISDIQPATP